MRLRCGAATAAWLAAVGLASPARAQHLDWRAAITATGAYTQSIGDASPLQSTGTATSASTQTFAGPSIALSPSLIGILDTPRTENTLSYAFSLTAPFMKGPAAPNQPVTYANRLIYSGHYALSEVTSMMFGASFAESPINTFVASQESTTTPIQATPSGAAYLLTVDAHEGITRQVSERMNFTQAGSFVYGNPIDPTSVRADTYSAQNAFTLTRIFSHDNVGASLTDQFNYFTASQAAPLASGPAPTVLPSQVWINTLALDWLHAFSEAITLSLTAGATQTVSPTSIPSMHVQPTGKAALEYRFNLVTAALMYAHQAQPNLTAGTVDFTDTASLRFGAPIGVTGFVTAGTLGFTHSTPVGTPMVACSGATMSCSMPNILGPSNVFLADATLDYHPPRIPTLIVGIRGQLSRQVVEADLGDSFTRYTISLNLTYAYPNANAAAMRPQLTPLFSTQAPSPNEITATDRFFGAPVAGPAPVEAAPLPKGP